MKYILIVLLNLLAAVAYADIVVIANANVDLTQADVKDVFMG